MSVNCCSVWPWSMKACWNWGRGKRKSGVQLTIFRQCILLTWCRCPWFCFAIECFQYVSDIQSLTPATYRKLNAALLDRMSLCIHFWFTIAWTYTCKHTNKTIHTYTHTYLHAYMHHTHIHTHTYIYMYVYTHTRILPAHTYIPTYLHT